MNSASVKENFLFIPIIIDETNNDLKIFSNNKIYDNWNKTTKKYHLISYILPTEDLEDLRLIKSNYELIEKYDFKEIIKKYFLDNSIIMLIFKNEQNVRILSKIITKDTVVIKNDTFPNLELGNYEEIEFLINKLKNKEFDAIVLSLAGIQMLNLENEVKEVFSTEKMLPAIGQGAIALQCKKDDHKTLNIVKKINDRETYYCTQAERALLEAIGGDCDTAIGGLAKILNEKIFLKSELFSNDGKKRFIAQSSGNFKEAKEIGYRVGNELLKKAGSDFKTQGN